MVEALLQIHWAVQWQVDQLTVEDLVLVADPHPQAAPQVHLVPQWQVD